MNEVKNFAAPVMQVRVAPQRRRSSIPEVEINWSNLSYTVKTSRNFFSRENGNRYKTILNNISGSFRSGQLVAMMGPSGAGKSSLLECISGKRTIGVSGDIQVSGRDRLKVGFVEQFDHHLEHLTVYEALVFASRLRNAERDYINHKSIANNLTKKLGLEVCENTLALKCSGGQRKRLSIALELVSKVDVLILDEPTTGLDSSATNQTIKAALSLTKQRKPIAIVATIHQPSAKMFNLFDKVYVLSNAGTCVYDGSPRNIVQTVSLIGLSVPNYYNPADFIIEVASGEYAKQSIHLLSHYNKELNKNKIQNNSDEAFKTVINAIEAEKSKRTKPFLKQLWILMSRSLKITIRDPDMFLLRVFTVFPMAFLIGLIFNSNVGQASGCPPSKLMLWKLNINELLDKFEEERYQLQENLSLLFMTLMMCQFGSYSAIILTFPLEMNVFVKEYRNSYYSIITYYVSKVLTDIPFCIMTSVSLTTIVYYMTGQLFDTYYRLLYVNLINLLVTLCGQSIGLIFGAAFLEDPNTATFASGIVILPLFIFAGFFRKLSLMPSYLVPFSYLSFFRYSLTGLLISVFGLNRCPYEHWMAEKDMNVSAMSRPQWLSMISRMLEYQNFLSDKESEESMDTPVKEPEENLMLMFGGKDAANTSDISLILSQFEIDGSEDSFWHEIQFLALFVVLMHFIIYFTLYWKVSRKN